MNNKKKICAFVLAPKIPESDETILNLKILSGIFYPLGLCLPNGCCAKTFAALFYFVAFEDFSVSFLNFLWYFDYHLFVYFAKGFLACSFLCKLSALDCDCFEFRAVVESFCRYALNV